MTVDEWLIEAVRIRPIIWNTKHPDYKNTVKKNEEYQAIANQFNMNVQEIRRKWHSIRSAFSRELRMRNLYSGSGLSEKRVWKHFNKLMFLQDECALELDGQVEHDYTIAIVSDDDNLINLPNQSLNESSNESNFNAFNNKNLSSGKKRKLNNIVGSTTNNHQSSNNLYLPNLNAHLSGEEIFGHSIAASLKKFDPKKQEIVKLRLQEVIVQHMND